MAAHLRDATKKIDYISREAAEQAKCEFLNENGEYAKGWNDCNREFRKNILETPAADVVPWKWLERYADYFCAAVSMPEFIREAKMFYESTNKAMEGGGIDGC